MSRRVVAGQLAQRVFGLMVALGCVAIFLAAPPPAGAAAPQSRPGPASLATGLLDGAAFEDPNAGVRAGWLARAQSYGSSWDRIAAVWLAIVSPRPSSSFRPTDPRDPNYHFGGLDTILREATGHGQRVLLTIMDPPSWALAYTAGPTGFNTSPRSLAVGAFARALAQRYSGRFPDPAHPGKILPRIDYFQAWNEPNLPSLIAPQWTRGRRGWISSSPGIYRGILNAVYANVKAVRPRAYVLAAGLAPYGDVPGRPYNRMHPVTFLSQLLCLQGPRLRPQRCPHPAHFDALDVHPYSLTPTSRAFNAADVSMLDIGKLRRVLRVARRTHRVLPAGPKPIWVTEVGWSSKPPDPSGIPLGLHASYVSRAFYELWRQGIDHVFWDLIADFPYKSLTGAGLFYQDGRVKPAAGAFRFPFVALPDSRGVLTLWGRAPGRGVVSIQLRRGPSWRPVLQLRTTAGGIFYSRRRLGRHLILRAVTRTATSVPWATG